VPPADAKSHLLTSSPPPRFLHGNKENVEKAAQQMRAHFRWRREESIESVIHEDFSDLEAVEEV